MLNLETLKLEEIEDSLYILKLNRPKQLNALNAQMLDEMDQVLDYLSGGELPQARGLIITGEGERAFAAGADISQMSSMTKEEAKAFSLKGNRVMRRIEQLPFPVIAAVNGYALGGGCELAMSCDIILCSSKAVFGQPESGLGICPGFGGTVRLMRKIGTQAAKELIYSGRSVRADEAVACGLAYRKYEPEKLLEEAVELMRGFLRNSGSAIRAAKASMYLGADQGVDLAIETEAECFSDCFNDPDQRNRMEAFLNKR